MKTRRLKEPGCGGHRADWLPKNKVEVFKRLFNKIKEKRPPYSEAVKFAGLSNCVMNGMNKGKLSAENGRKILAAYKKLYT